jgi:hypothetical protein
MSAGGDLALEAIFKCILCLRFHIIIFLYAVGSLTRKG